MSTQLFNPTPIDMQTQYAGITINFPSGKLVRLKTIRKPGGENLVAEDIAMKCWLDLGQKGLILVNEDDPQSMEEMREEGARLLEAFIRSNNRDFNENQITLANEGRPKQKVPKDLRELNKVLPSLIGGHGGDEDDDLEVNVISQDAFNTLKEKSAKDVNEVLAMVREAYKRGDLGKVQEILGGTKPAKGGEKAIEGGAGQPSVAGPDNTEDNPEPSGDAMEEGIVDPPFRPGHEPGRAAPAARGGKQGKPGPKSARA